MEVQTRTSFGELKFYTSVKDAHQACISDKTIWKISWDNHRFCRQTKIIIKNDDVQGDMDESEKLEEIRMCKLSEQYAACTDPKKIFWVNHPLELVAEYASLNIRMQLLTDMKCEKENPSNKSNQYFIDLKQELEETQQKYFPDGFCKENCIIEVLTDDEFQQKYCLL